MSHLSLAARYRPQKFAEVAGSPQAAAALSRAAAEDRVAPAYLLSGTRGIGKTTIARIFAKALNCQNGPGPEPCNECPQCRHITAGNHVDVNEIDAASNTGVDDVRALRETIGFVPMEGRYKIFIVDEAHMLSKSAFNALLKTLEEPPSHTVFILATTEAHRFPATIISRCQHFVFRHLPEQTIYDHITKILTLEGVEFEPDAARIVARRAAGSVRDSLSLLDQALALTSGKLEAGTVRSALGVAGPELYANLLDVIARGDCAGIIDLTGGLLSSGIDLGFFTRELGSLLRNLFLYRQSGEKILAGLNNITEDERNFIKSRASAFTTAHLHGAWQMLLESQRGISQSPEPGAALELLLLNIALLPQLLPVGKVNGAPLADSSAPAAASPPAAEAETNVDSVGSGGSEKDSESGVTEANRRDWTGFCEFCRKAQDAGREAPPQDLLRSMTVRWQDQRLQLSAVSHSQWERMTSKLKTLEEALSRYCDGNAPEIIFPEPKAAKSHQELLEEGSRKPELQLCQKILDARISEYIEDNGEEK